MGMEKMKRDKNAAFVSSQQQYTGTQSPQDWWRDILTASPKGLVHADVVEEEEENKDKSVANYVPLVGAWWWRATRAAGFVS